MELALPVGQTPLIENSRRRAWLTLVSDVSKQRNENSVFQCSISHPVCVHYGSSSKVKSTGELALS